MSSDNFIMLNQNKQIKNSLMMINYWKAERSITFELYQLFPFDKHKTSIQWIKGSRA